MFKRCLLFTILICIGIGTYTQAHAQNSTDENKNPYSNLSFIDRTFIGGNFGLSFGTITRIHVAPAFGYRISPKFSVGLGPSYQYYKDSRPPEFQTSIYGGSVFARYFPLDMIFLQTEFQILNLESFSYSQNSEIIRNRVNVPVFFVGGGYTQRSAGGSGIYIGILYDLIGDVNSPYPDNFTFRIGGFLSL